MNLISKTGEVDDDDICQDATQLAKFFFGTHGFNIEYNSVMFVCGCVCVFVTRPMSWGLDAFFPRDRVRVPLARITPNDDGPLIYITDKRSRGRSFGKNHVIVVHRQRPTNSFVPIHSQGRRPTLYIDYFVPVRYIGNMLCVGLQQSWVLFLFFSNQWETLLRTRLIYTIIDLMRFSHVSLRQ